MKQKYLMYYLIIFVFFFACKDNPVDIKEENSAPIALFNVTPDSGDINTIFFFDGSHSSDNEDPDSSLQFRWDWEDDGQWDTEYLKQDTISHRYSQSGNYSVRLEVMDSGGLTDTVSKSLIVSEKKDSIIISFLTQLTDIGTPVKAEDGYLFLTKGNDLIINDISSSYIPNQLSSINFQSSVTAVTLLGDVMLVGTKYNGLKIVDITNIYNPVLIDSINNLPVYSIKINNGIIGVCYSEYVRFYDFQLNSLGSIGGGSTYFRDFATHNNYVYVSEQWAGVGNYLCGYDISDIGNIGNPLFTRTFDSAYKLEICNNNLLALDGGNGRIELFNISNPVNLQSEDYAYVGWTNDMVVKNDTLFAIGNDGGGISIFCISDSSKFVFKGNNNLMGSTRSLAVYSNFIYITPFDSDDLYIFKYSKY